VFGLLGFSRMLFAGSKKAFGSGTRVAYGRASRCEWAANPPEQLLLADGHGLWPALPMQAWLALLATPGETRIPALVSCEVLGDGLNR
jgi:hypothetical protein